MFKLKGVKEIDDIINIFTLTNFGLNARLAPEFLAFCDERTVGYTFIIASTDNKFFIEDAQARFPTVHADIFLWLLMHEIGHCMTYRMWSEEDLTCFWQRKEDLTKEPNEWYRNNWYHAIPDEFFATRFAGMFMENNPSIIKQFWNKLQPALFNFYKINNLI